MKMLLTKNDPNVYRMVLYTVFRFFVPVDTQHPNGKLQEQSTASTQSRKQPADGKGERNERSHAAQPK